MSGQSFRWRTVLEVAVISVVIYVFLGTPGLPSQLRGTSSTGRDVPIARAKVESLVYPDKDLKCLRHDFDIHLFSASPLVIYIDGFLSDKEADHLVDIRHYPLHHDITVQYANFNHSSDKWQVSTVFNEGIETTDETVRKSEKALIDRDTTVQCIEQRALAVQGWPEETFIERLWTQRYNLSGHYAHHYDWASASKQSRRVSTFMVYMSAKCEGGGVGVLNSISIGNLADHLQDELPKATNAEGSQMVRVR